MFNIYDRRQDVIHKSAPPATATGHIFAEIVPIFTASETSQMNFGKFSPGPGGGEIILSPQSTISVIGSVYKGTGSHNAASFYVTGDMDATFTITLPSNPVVLTHLSDRKNHDHRELGIHSLTKYRCRKTPEWFSDSLRWCHSENWNP